MMKLRLPFESRLLLALPVFIAYFVSSSATNSAGTKLREIATWKTLEFAFSSKQAEAAAIASGEYVTSAPVPIDVDVYTEGVLPGTRGPVIFVTIPRFLSGVPATLGYVTDKKSPDGNPIIAPYPDWRRQRPGGDCSGITSVFRVYIDPCHRIWILDTGKVGSQRVCPPQLLVYSLKTNELLRKHKFPKDLYTDASLFVTPVVDIRDPTGACQDVFVYIADVTGFGLIVYDYRNMRSWKIVNKLFYPYPQYGTFDINRETFDLMDGILGLALGPVKRDGDRILYFHSLASRTESWVPTSIIRNHSIFEHDSEASPRSFQCFKNERPSQAAAQAMDKNGVLFYGLMSDLAIGCWSSQNYPEFGGNNVAKVVVDSATLQFASGMKIVTPCRNNRQELWVLTSSFQKIMVGSLRATETNFRIQVADVDELVRGTKCDFVPNRNNEIQRHVVNRQIPTFSTSKFNYLKQ